MLIEYQLEPVFVREVEENAAGYDKKKNLAGYQFEMC